MIYDDIRYDMKYEMIYILHFLFQAIIEEGTIFFPLTMHPLLEILLVIQRAGGPAPREAPLPFLLFRLLLLLVAAVANITTAALVGAVTLQEQR